MEYEYHCQYQAEAFANAIIPVPENYPLKNGLPENFRTHFVKLCEIAKNIYNDMAKQPESYGIMLIGIESKDHHLIRKAQNTIHRFVDTLSRLSACGEVKKHQLIVSVPAFKDAIKKSQSMVAGPVPKYELILSRLVDFGFVISENNLPRAVVIIAVFRARQRNTANSAGIGHWKLFRTTPALFTVFNLTISIWRLCRITGGYWNWIMS